ADPVAGDADADVLLRELVSCEERLQRLCERLGLAQLAGDDDALGERIARKLEQLGGAVVRDAGGSELRRTDLQADVALDVVSAPALRGARARERRQRELRQREVALQYRAGGRLRNHGNRL